MFTNPLPSSLSLQATPLQFRYRSIVCNMSCHSPSFPRNSRGDKPGVTIPQTQRCRTAISPNKILPRNQGRNQECNVQGFRNPDGRTLAVSKKKKKSGAVRDIGEKLFPTWCSNCIHTHPPFRSSVTPHQSVTIRNPYSSSEQLRMKGDAMASDRGRRRRLEKPRFSNTCKHHRNSQSTIHCIYSAFKSNPHDESTPRGGHRWGSWHSGGARTAEEVSPRSVCPTVSPILQIAASMNME